MVYVAVYRKCLCGHYEEQHQEPPSYLLGQPVPDAGKCGRPACGCLYFRAAPTVLRLEPGRRRPRS